jgi:murein L,D-transpeptidase YcbB/YkuD
MLAASVALAPLSGAPALAAAQPQSLLPPTMAAPTPSPAPITAQPVVPATRDNGSTEPGAPGVVVPATPPDTTPVPIVEPVAHWSLADAQALLSAIQGIDAEGLIAADYQPDALLAAISAGPGARLDDVASHSFDWLAEDLRDGRTPMDSRIQWFAVDPDADLYPTATLLQQALTSHDIAGTLAGLDPNHGEYEALKEALAATPVSDTATRTAIQVNMDRWRWLPRELGLIYLIVNVPEYEVRLVSNHNIIRSYRTIVGKPGRTATPQLAETVQAVVFNPTWTVPQSIIQREGLGAKLMANPASARRQGYKVTESEDGVYTVVQQPGPTNSLGLMKIDMPNPHAIYLHDTPERQLFEAKNRAFSHGCIRTEKAVELGMIMAMLGANLSPADAIEKSNSHKYNRVTMTKTFPVYINYITYGRDLMGQLVKFADIYGRDAAVVASFAAPRQLKTTQRSSNEAVIKLDNPL